MHPSNGPVVTIEDIIDECVRQRKGGTVKSQVYLTSQRQVFATCWDALNRWILFRMEKRQGADIPNFAKLAWEYFKTADGTQTRCRPVFIPTEGFCQAFKVKYKPPQSLPYLGPMEELNYSKVSIKFSKSLTKDVLFVGLRDIIRKTGEMVAARREVRLSLSVGHLVAKDRKINFEFDALVLTTPDNGAPFDAPPISAHRDFLPSGRSSARRPSARSLPGSARSQQSAYLAPSRASSAPRRQRSPPQAAAPPAEEREEREENPAPPMEEEEQPPGSPGHDVTEEEGVGLAEATAEPAALHPEEEEEGGGSQRRSHPEVSKLPLDRLLQQRPRTTGGSYNRFPSRLLRSTKDQATAEVLKQGYQRYMCALKELAEEDKVMRSVIDKEGHVLDEKERSKQDEAARQRKNVQAYIVTQIQRREQEKLDALKEEKRLTSTTIPLKPDPRLSNLAVSRAELVQTLSMQIKHKEDRKSTEKARRLQEEQRYLEYLNEELKLQSLERRRKQLETRALLKATWDMEAEFTKCKEILKKRGGTAVLEHLDRSGLEHIILTPSYEERVAAAHLAGGGVGFDSRR